MLVALGARTAQLLLSATALIISVILVKGYGPGHNPSVIDYGAFCGGGAIIIAIIGIFSIFLDKISGIVVLALDALAAFFLLAGGLAFAIQAKIGSCTDVSDGGYLGQHLSLFAPSSEKYAYEADNASQYIKDDIHDTENRCRMVQATTAFVWLTFGCFLVTIALGLRNKATKHSGSIV